MEQNSAGIIENDRRSKIVRKKDSIFRGSELWKEFNQLNQLFKN